MSKKLHVANRDYVNDAKKSKVFEANGAARNTQICDVFISHSDADSDVATKLAHGALAVGFEPFLAGPTQVRLGSDAGHVIWDALAESRAIVFVITPPAGLHSMALLELGAAGAWEKPIFVVANGSPSAKLPTWLQKYPSFPASRLETVLHAIGAEFEPLTDEERDWLLSVYRTLGVSADQLTQSPEALDDLASRFNRSAHKPLSGERLLSEILRLRKKQLLPKVHRKKSLSA